MRLGRLEEALGDYTQAINMSPVPQAAYYLNRAIVSKMLEQPEKARKDFMMYKNIKDNR